MIPSLKKTLWFLLLSAAVILVSRSFSPPPLSISEKVEEPRTPVHPEPNLLIPVIETPVAVPSIPRQPQEQLDQNSLEYRTSAKHSLEHGIFSGGMPSPQKQTMSRAIFVSPITGFSEFYNLSKQTAFEKASLLAKKDFGNETIKILTYGERSAAKPAEIYLMENYGISTGTIAESNVSEGIIGATEGYNSTMKRLLIQKFGKDIFKEALEKTKRD